MDSTGVQALIDKLRDLSATKFVDSGFTTPAVGDYGGFERRQAHRESADRRRPGANFIARRMASRPRCMKSTASAVEDLRRRPPMSKSSRQRPPRRNSAHRPSHRPLPAHHGGGLFRGRQDRERATFELFVRRLPHNRNFHSGRGLAAGRRISAEPALHRERKSPTCADLPQFARHQHRLLRYAGRAALHGRPFRGRRKARRCSRASRF